MPVFLVKIYLLHGSTDSKATDIVALLYCVIIKLSLLAINNTVTLLFYIFVLYPCRKKLWSVIHNHYL